ncbi:flagellar assembly protein FliH [Shewanella eurypsychrophilus]|uniref:Flagellar assembly protein FliH n=1 Tax=Shewanella eurypsychrophilus TaxID=2593656 RepID=A0ABX6V8M6_9GAMM|nr:MULTISPECIES: flagellar assembly protein FliH [Shewanella]QFU23488.1 flagellar assembly protein FliH [Shewanella sp. YLB-09]QPG58714.1 flagellar assembly protein FliH [Shewanella eurypsychrophilus]
MKPDSQDKDKIDPGIEPEFTSWQIPDITQADPEQVSNLFGRRSIAKLNVEETQSYLPPTLAEIEAIREQAEQEGLEQGKDQGYKSGLESGRLEGLKQGHEEGTKQGLEQGYVEGLEQAKNLLEKFESILTQFEKPLELLDTEIEQELVALTIKLTRAVVGHEIKTHPEHILAALRQGVDSLPIKEQGVSIRLHPDDFLLVQELYSVNQLEKNQWQLESDPSLSAGDCIINSQRSSVDMRLEQRLTSVLETMSHHLSHLNQTHEQQAQALPSYNRSEISTKPIEDVDEPSSSEPEKPLPSEADNANSETGHSYDVQPSGQVDEQGTEDEQSP